MCIYIYIHIHMLHHGQGLRAVRLGVEDDAPHVPRTCTCIYICVYILFFFFFFLRANWRNPGAEPRPARRAASQ